MTPMDALYVALAILALAMLRPAANIIWAAIVFAWFNEHFFHLQVFH